MLSFKFMLPLAGAAAIALLATGANAQTAADYSQYAQWPAPTAQGQNVNGIHIYMYAGLKSHGPGAHDYPYWLDSWSKLLTRHGAVVDGGLSFPSEQKLKATDVLVIYKGDAGYMTPQERAELQKYIKRGGGIVTLHDSLCGPDPADMATIVGAGKKHGQVNYTWTATLDYEVVDKGNPIIKGMPLQIYDEAFYNMAFAPKGVHPILTVKMPDTPAAEQGHGVGKVVPQMWTYEHTAPGGTAPARAFVWMQGHMVDSLNDPAIRNVVMRGIAWAAKKPYDTLTDYVPPPRHPQQAQAVAR